MPQDKAPIGQLVNRFETQTNLVFKPHHTFYERVGINRFRFAQLVRGDKRPDSKELREIIDYFNQFFEVKATDLLI